MRRRRRTAGARAGILASCAATIALIGAGVGLARIATPPSIVKDPSISGSAVVNETLTGDQGTWSGSKTITYTYQWLRCDSKGETCASISGATGKTYKLLVDDLGSTLRFRVTATNKDGSKFETSKPTAVVTQASGKPANSKAPTISGSPLVGSVLSASTGTWVGTEPITYSYQWQRCDGSGNACAARSGETSADYTVVKNDVGKTLRVQVKAKNSRGNGSAISAATAVVQDATGGVITLPNGEKSVPVTDVPKGERLIVDTVQFNPNPVTSRSVPIQVRIKVEDTRGYVVRGALVFFRSTPILTETPTDAPTGTDGWITYHVLPRSDFPLKTGYSVQFYVKAYRKGDPTLAGISGTRLVQVATHS
jgi:hypothetical protein